MAAIITINDEDVVFPVHFRSSSYHATAQNVRYAIPKLLCGKVTTLARMQYTHLKVCVTCPECLEIIRGHLVDEINSIRFLDDPFKQYYLDQKIAQIERLDESRLIKINPIVDNTWIERWHD